MTTITEHFPSASPPVVPPAADAPAGRSERPAGSAVPEAVAAAGPAATPKHSRRGLVSFALSLLVGGGEFLLIAVAAVLAAANSGILDATSPAAVGLGLLMCAGVPVSLLGVALGTVGLFEKDRRKAFAAIGLILNLAIAAAIGLLYFIGSQMPAAAS